MRRVLTFLTAIVLLLVSLGVGLFTADLPFWRRALQLPLPADGGYLPVATLGTPGVRPVETVASGAPSFDALVVEEAANLARGAGARALLVTYRGKLEIERYFLADDASSLLPAGLVARPVIAMATGIAISEKRIASLDTPVSHYLPEWDGEARGRITVRQLLEETSGLEAGGDVSGLLYRSPWENLSGLPAFATSRGVRMLLGNDFKASALAFRPDHEPGGFYDVSPANTQLAAVILERATGVPLETYIDERLWRAVGAGEATLTLDRRAGMPAAHCCWRATARDMLRVLGLLGTDGVHGETVVLPSGWVREMSTASRVHAETGMQVSRSNLGGEETLGVTDDNGSAFWVIPTRQLAILSVANPGGRSLPELPALLLKGLEAAAAN